MSGITDSLEKFAVAFSRWLNYIAGAGVVAMLGLTVADIIGIKIFKSPVPGAIEIVGFLGIVILAFGVAYTQVVRGHIQVEFFVMRLPDRARAGATALISILGVVLFALLSWQSYDFGRTLQATGEVSMTQHIPFYPFVHAIAFCCIAICLVLLAEFLRALRKAVKR